MRLLFAALLALLLLSSGRLFGQLVAVNGPVLFPSTNVTSSSAPQVVLLKTTAAETGGLSGVGGRATSATFDRPSDVIVDPAGNVYFGAETALQIFRIDA